MLSRLGQHLGRQIGADDVGIGKPLANRPRTGAGACAEVESAPEQN
jgi:hypothetical protein